MNETEKNSILIPAQGGAVFVALFLFLQIGGSERAATRVEGEIVMPGLLELTGEDNGDEFGHALLGNEDLDGDGVADIVVGAPQAPEGGTLTAFSGRTGRVIWGPALAPEGLQGFGSCLVWFDDLDGDGVPEIGVGAPDGTRGAIAVRSGKSGAHLGLVLGKRADDRFGHAISVIGDIDEDGIGDLAIGAPGTHRRNAVGRVYLISGKDASILGEVSLSRNKGDRFGFALCSPGDLDGDGCGDLVVGAIDDNRGGYHAGSVTAWSTRSGELLHRIDGDADLQSLGRALSACGDRDRDGVGDYLVTSYPEKSAGAVHLVSGKTGEVVSHIEGREGQGFGFSVAPLADLDHDGMNDLAVGAPNAGCQGLDDVGLVYLFSGRDGHMIGRLEGDREGAFAGFAIAAGGDADRDGEPEILVGCLQVIASAGRVVVAEAPEERKKSSQESKKKSHGKGH